MIFEEQNIDKKLLRIKQEIDTVIEQNQDFKPFIIGDRVKVWDGSYNKDKFTQEHRFGIDELFLNNTGIVISNNCNEIDYDEILQTSTPLEILISIGDTEVYISKSCIKHI